MTATRTAAVALGLAIAAAGGFASARLGAPAPPAPAPAPAAASSKPPEDTVAISADGIRTSEISVAPAATGSLAASMAASATVAAAPDAEAVLSARAAGTVTRLFKRIGDPVRAGETIALVQSRDAAAIAADRGMASARMTLARQQMERERVLLAQGVSPRADYETAAAAMAVAQVEARRAQAAAGAAGVTRDGRSVAVVSPISGRITSARASLGAFVQADTELFRVADARRLQIITSLPPADAARARPGDRVELSAGDGPPITGKVRSATGVVDPQTRQAIVTVTLTSGGSLLVPGQMVRARILASGGVAAGITVPQDAVQTLGDRSVVFVRITQGFKAQTVRVEGRSGGYAQVSGIAAGTPIATVNAFLLKAELGKEAAE